MNIPISVTVGQYSVSISTSHPNYITTNPSQSMTIPVTVTFGSCPPQVSSSSPLYIYDQNDNILATVTGPGTYNITIVPANYGCTASSSGGYCAVVHLYIGPSTTQAYASTSFTITYQPPQQCALSGVTSSAFQSVLSNGCWNCTSSIAGNPFPIQMVPNQPLQTTIGIPSPQCSGAYYLTMYLCTTSPCTSSNAFFTSSSFNCGAEINYFSMTIPQQATSTGVIYVTLQDSCGNTVTGGIPVATVNCNFNLSTNILVNATNIASNPNISVSPNQSVRISAGVAITAASVSCISNGYPTNIVVLDNSGNTVCQNSAVIYPQVLVTGSTKTNPPTPIYTPITCAFTAPSIPGSYQYTVQVSVPSLNLSSSTPFMLLVGQAMVSVSDVNVTPSAGVTCSGPTTSGNVQQWTCQGPRNGTVQVSMLLTNTGSSPWVGSVTIYDQNGNQVATTGTITITSGASQSVSLTATVPSTYPVGQQITWFVAVNGNCSNCVLTNLPIGIQINEVAVIYITVSGAPPTYTASGLPTSITSVVGQTVTLQFNLTCNPQIQGSQQCPSSVTVTVTDTANDTVLASNTFANSTNAPYMGVYQVTLSWTANVPNVPGNTSCFTGTVTPQCGSLPTSYASCLSVTAIANNTTVWSATLPYIICPSAVSGQVTASLSTNTVNFVAGGYNTFQNVYVYLNNTSSNSVTVTCMLVPVSSSTQQPANICFGGAGIYNVPCQFTTTVQAQSSAMGMFQIAYSQSTFPSAGTHEYQLVCNCGGQSSGAVGTVLTGGGGGGAAGCTVSISNPYLWVNISSIAFAVIGPNNCVYNSSMASGVSGTCSVSGTVSQSMSVPITVNIYMSSIQQLIVSITLSDQSGNVLANYSTTWCSSSGSNCNVVNQPIMANLQVTAPSSAGIYQWTASITIIDPSTNTTVGQAQLPITADIKPQITFSYGYLFLPSNTVRGPNGTSQDLIVLIGCNCPSPTAFRVKLYNAAGQLLTTLDTPQIGPNAPGNATCPSAAGSFCQQYDYFALIPISVRLPSLFELIVVRGIPQSTLVSNYTTYGYLWQEPYTVTVEPITT